MRRTIFIGLGAMGLPMAENLAASGMLDAVWNRTHHKAEDTAMRLGIRTSPLLSEAVSDCDTAFLCVRADEDVLAIAGQLAECMAENSIIVDCSTVSAQTARTVAGHLASHNIHFLDAPVTGGVEGARLARLVFMAGGSASHLESVRPMMQAMGQTVMHMGDTGTGQATKAVNQVMCAGINQAVTEALAFGCRMDLDMTKVIAAISGGAAGNWFMDKRGAGMLAGQFPPGFKVELHHKDLAICLAMAEALAIPLPLTERTLDDYAILKNMGYGEEDISALFRLKESVAQP